ncbi:MAG: T9SS type A sorting domain-containing protein [Ignavibacteriae bacterium]|nr:T9SS type A sorting domain-containing protein [Ignavibacteriota bacterium]
MNTLVLFFITGLFLLFSGDLRAYNTLQVQDVKQTWRYSRGTIDSAVLTVKPAGAYFEYGLYLTFSSKGSTMTKSTDTLEIQYFFDLSPNAIMIDSWLWVEDTIVKAVLMDQGQAQQIYEGIVSRRRDPSILYKRSQTGYEFRIFPLVGSSSRTVKISWLEPASWSAKTVSALLDTPLLQVSLNPLTKLRVIALTDSKWTDPSISMSEYVFEDVDDPFYGKGKQVWLKNSAFPSLPSIRYSSPLQNGFYLQCYQDAPGEGYYQLIMLTKQAVDITTKKKTLFIVDYDASQSALSRKDILKELQNTILNAFAAKDSFNILLSNNTEQLVSKNWISATAENINATFAGIKDEQLAIFSYLQLSLPNAMKYLKRSSGKANIILISNSDGLGNYKVANPLIAEISIINDYIPQVNCIDFSNARRTYIQNSNYYYGNFYLYDYLVKWSGGNYLDANKTSVALSTSISNLLNSAEGKIQSLELYTTLDDGFCYGRYDQISTQAQKDAGIVFQVGRYYGKLPVVVRATGFYQDQPFNKEVRLDAVPEPDPLKMIRRIWNGNYISKLETGTVTNEVIKEIIDISRRNRVLSMYTAFLALEPWRMPKDDYLFYQPDDDDNNNDDDDDNISLVIDENITVSGKDVIRVTAYPNPFTSQLKIECSELASGVEITSVEIYNTLGSLVKTFSGDVFGGNKNFVWLGDDNSGMEVQSGMYIVVVKTTKGIVRFNVVLNR